MAVREPGSPREPGTGENSENRGEPGPICGTFRDKARPMRPRTYFSIAALLLLAAPRIATPQASEPCCQVNPPATAEPSQPVSTIRGSDKAPITILVFSDFESFPCARSASVIDRFLKQT